MGAVDTTLSPVFKTASIGLVSKTFTNAVRSTEFAELAAMFTIIGLPPLKEGNAGIEIVTVAAELPLAKRNRIGVSATCPDVASGGASQNSVPTCAFKTPVDATKITAIKNRKNLVIELAFDNSVGIIFKCIYVGYR